MPCCVLILVRLTYIYLCYFTVIETVWFSKSTPKNISEDTILEPLSTELNVDMSWQILANDMSRNDFALHHIHQGCLRPQTFFEKIGLKLLPWNSLASISHYQLRYSAGCFRLCDWLSLWCLVLWISYLAPVCWSTFCKAVLNELVCKFDLMVNRFSLLLLRSSSSSSSSSSLSSSFYTCSIYWYITALTILFVLFHVHL